MTWAVYHDVAGEGVALHVMPTDEAKDEVVNGHTATSDCFCHPKPLPKDGPFDTLILSHRDPEHPGSDDYLKS